MNITLDHVPATPYKISQFTSHFRYGTDAILLSWYAKSTTKDICIDLCSGTGIVAIRQSYLYHPKKTYAIEMQKEVAELSVQSIENNNLSEKIHVMQGNFTEMADCFAVDSIDVVMANPPYIRKGDGEISKDRQFAFARHEISMKLEDLFIFCSRVLHSGGLFYFIHRPNRLGEIIGFSIQYDLAVKQIQPVASYAGDDPQLILVTCKKAAKPDLVLKSPLVIYDGDSYTKELLEIYDGAVR